MLLPLGFFYLFYALDVYKTRKGIFPDASNEANPLIRYLFMRAPRWLHYSWDVLYPTLVTALALILPPFWSLWLAYSAAVGHLGGFLSWTRLNRWRPIKPIQIPSSQGVAVTLLIGVAAIAYGYMLVIFHTSYLL